ncbi:coiled-coil domain-containing protein 7-like isoform X3 [Leopardus geoffroyi]|nr:coiled-coil domain-containing protein 7-like isoform X3 [Leopardus geoffroyi]XP_045319262.1 coiled-coil domain-containing protein 7-like isoform X3 [Leopardus geoffroyi]XP_045319263.1 coiled-coil domain-containing protein 7-like isoform X3 [Leopardus geoffroyi]
MLKHQDSKSETEMQVKKQKTSQGEAFITPDNITDESPVLELQESMSKTQLQVNKQKIAKEERVTKLKLVDKVLRSVTQKANVDQRNKLEGLPERPVGGSIRHPFGWDPLEAHDKVPGNHDPKDSMSKTQLQVKKQRASKGERFYDISGKKLLWPRSKRLLPVFSFQDEVPDENNLPERQDSMSESEIEVEKQTSHKGERPSTLNEVLDENLKLKHQDSVSKTQVQFKKQKKSMEERISTHFGVPDENLMLVNEDSVSQPQMQVEKQITYRKKRRHTYFGIPDENLMFASQDSASKSQVQVKKQITSRKERRKTEKMDEKAGKNLSPEDNEVLISKGSSQIKTLGATRKVGFTKHERKYSSIIDQDTYEPSDFTLEDLELTIGYKDQRERSRVYQSQRLNVKTEVASELPDMADIPAINPSISDLILQLDLNKVIETDIEHLKNAIERSILVKEKKIQSKSLPGVNLFKNRYMSTQHQEDFFNSHIAPHKFSTNRISFSTFDTQERSEYISPHVNKPPKAYHRTSRAGSTIYKTIQFPSLNKEPSGHPKNSISNKKKS